MTMDIANQVKSTVISEELTVPQSKSTDYQHVAKVSTNKRSFDVAFLMLPDEKLKQKQLDKQAKLNGVSEYPTHQISVKNDLLLRSPPAEHFDLRDREDSEEIDIVSNGVTNNNNHSPTEHLRQLRYHSLPSVGRLQRIYDDPTILPSPDRGNLSDLDAHRSAFTKVPHIRGDSPNPSISPDQLSCPSISPPVSVSPPRSYPPTGFRPTEYAFVNGAGPFQPQQPNPPSPSKSLKQQFMYRPGQDLPPGYLPSGPFPFSTTTHPFMQQQSDIAGIVRNPAAAAILSTLIPPTLASTFSLTAQNICAKCNISFRMTSDLVYHMRSHHKNDMIGDPMRRKREEKLKCPVCNESFRERHHLTRHMTAHQDKESDDTDPKSSSTPGASGSSFAMTQLHPHSGRRSHQKTH
ncbi:PR domain zinc finger protein 8 [Sergentomyia squamirostris]